VTTPSPTPVPAPNTPPPPPSDPDQLLAQLVDMAVEWARRRQVGDGGAPLMQLGDQVARYTRRLDEILAAGGVSLPIRWAKAAPPTPTPPPDASAEVKIAADAVKVAVAAFDAVQAAIATAQLDRKTAADTLGQARASYYELARKADMSR
jgi:hypothetical protein